MNKQEQLLTILYDLSQVISSEVHIQPLLKKMLQRLLYHTGFSCGLVLSNQILTDGRKAQRLECSIGDRQLKQHLGKDQDVYFSQISGEIEKENSLDLSLLPVRKDYYKTHLELCVPDYGLILLLGVDADKKSLPFKAMFSPVLSNLARAIQLCKISESYTKKLVADREKAETDNERFRQALDTTSDFIFLINPETGEIIDFNQSAANALELNKDDLPNLKLSDLFNRYSPSSVTELVNKLISCSGSVIEEAECKCENGNKFPTEIRFSLLKIENTPITLIAVVSDITNRKKEESTLRKTKESLEKVNKELRHSEAYLRVIMENAVDAIITINEHGNILSFNHASEKIFGYSESEVINKNVKILTSEPHKEMHDSYIENYLHTGKKNIIDSSRNVDGMKKDGTLIPIRLGVSEIKFDGRSVFTALIHDLTEQNRTKQELIESREQAEIANRAKSEFLAVMSHEIRTPLNGVIGMSALALNTDLDPKQRNYIEKVHVSAESLLSIINDVLDFSKIEAGYLRLENIRFNLNDVLDKVTNLVGLKSQEIGLEFVFDISPAVPRVLIGDPTRLTQILVNLGSNAVKFTKIGEIQMRVSILNEENTHIKLKFEVIDTGIGIDIDKQKNLFNAFTQADSSVSRQYGGTGLGLTISKRLIELMGGEINLESELGQGSNFNFSIEFECNKGDSLPCHLLPEGIENMHAMIVDDNETVRSTMNDILLSFGFRVTLCTSGMAAIQKLEASNVQNIRYDLIFMDWKMPGLDGIAATEKIIKNKNFSKPRVILMVTAYSASDLTQSIKNIDINGILIKPVNPSTLLDCVLRTFGRKGFLPSINTPLLPDRDNDVLAKLRGSRILLVEDNEINQILAVELLNEAGIETTVANNGKEALDIILKENEFHAVLMDVHMPEMDGYTATRMIRKHERFKKLPIIATTANALVGDREKCLESGMNDYLSKPLNIQKLFETLARFIYNKTIIIETPTKTKIVNSKIDFPKIENVDTKTGLFVCNNKASLYRRLLNKFIKNETFSTEFHSALLEQDIETAVRLAHTLKSVAGNIGAQNVHVSAESLQNLVKNNASTQEIQLQTAQVTAELDIVIKALKQFFVTQPIEQSAKTDTIDFSQLKSQIQSLAQQLKNNETSARDMCEGLKIYLIDSQYESKFNEIQEYIDVYDFESALQALYHLEQMIDRT